MKHDVGTKAKPRKLKTPPGTSEYTMHLEEKDGKEVLVCTVGKTVLHYDPRCIDDLHAMLEKHGFGVTGITLLYLRITGISHFTAGIAYRGFNNARQIAD